MLITIYSCILLTKFFFSFTDALIASYLIMYNKIEESMKAILYLIIIFVTYGCASTRVENIREYRLDLSPESTAKFLTIVMTTGVDLDEDKKYRVYLANLTHSKETISALNDDKNKDAITYQELKTISQTRDEEIKNILTKQQYKVYLARENVYEKNLKSFVILVRERRKEDKELEQLLKYSTFEMEVLPDDILRPEGTQSE